MLDIAMEQIPDYKVAFIRRVGPYGIENQQTMEALKQWAKDNRLLDGETVILGIAQDDPARVAPEDCRYDTCVVVPEGFCFAGVPVCEGRVTGGKYAVLTIQHTACAVSAAWAGLFDELSGRELRLDESRPVIERYRARMVQNHLCELCVPVC